MAELNEGAIAQLGERYNGIVEVSGSIPLSSTNFPRGQPSNKARRSRVASCLLATVPSKAKL